jgi:hypothetical protein
MTPTRISELPEGLRQLAQLRRSEMPIGEKNEDVLVESVFVLRDREATILG